MEGKIKSPLKVSKNSVEPLSEKGNQLIHNRFPAVDIDVTGIW